MKCIILININQKVHPYRLNQAIKIINAFLKMLVKNFKFMVFCMKNEFLILFIFAR